MAKNLANIQTEIIKLHASAHELHKKKSAFDAQAKDKIDKLMDEVDDIYERLKKLTDAEWNDIDKNEKSVIIRKISDELPSEIKIAEDALSGIDVATAEAYQVTLTGVVFLLVLIGIYLGSHIFLMHRLYDSESEQAFLQTIGAAKGELAKQTVNLPVVNALVKSLSNPRGDLLVDEFVARINLLQGFVSTLPGGEATAKTKSEGKSRVADQAAQAQKIKKQAFTADQSDTGVKTIREEIEKMEKEALSLSGNAGFFWIAGFWKWIEIVFWGEFGVIIGILSWVSSKMESGEYTKQEHRREIYWYLAEVAIGPIVVTAVFFLLKQLIGTILTGITVTEGEVRGSILTTLGISFALGLFIRRTLGIFDFIKDKLPLPKS